MNSATDIWSKVLDILGKDLTQTAITTWFDDCSAVDLSGSRLILHTPSEYKKAVIEERFLGSIKNALNELFSTQDFEIKILNDNELKTMKEAPSETD
ncbi:MAG: chromosomal replication initiator protein DnaA, partial [Oscillospiraceae bacterium]|nr:chromosomal replication initiator protein DnaA [Oscillospiraceae bacterium]MDR2599779.1 chromosomal replication initiator protein DnaA [Oscillospiraceae bacterium]